MAADRLAGLDMAFLCLEHPSSPLHMGAVAVFRPVDPVDPAGLVTLLAERAQRIPRMRQRVRRSWFPPAGAEWAEDPDLNVDDHIRVHALAAGSGRHELAAVAARLMAEPLDMTRAPWRLHVVTGLAGGRFALLTKLHHALVTVPSGQRRIGLLSLDVGDVHRIRRRHGGTLNDVVLTVVTGALRRWLASRGHPTRGMTVRALIPVSQRGRAGGNGGGNQLSGYLCELPVGEPDPIRRLTAIRASMDRNKAAGPHRGAGAVPLLAHEVPDVLHRLGHG
jgi:hypothetical protein